MHKPHQTTTTQLQLSLRILLLFSLRLRLLLHYLCKEHELWILVHDPAPLTIAVRPTACANLRAECDRPSSRVVAAERKSLRHSIPSAQAAPTSFAHRERSNMGGWLGNRSLYWSWSHHQYCSSNHALHWHELVIAREHAAKAVLVLMHTPVASAAAQLFLFVAAKVDGTGSRVEYCSLAAQHLIYANFVLAHRGGS